MTGQERTRWIHAPQKTGAKLGQLLIPTAPLHDVFTKNTPQALSGSNLRKGSRHDRGLQHSDDGSV